MVRWGSFILFLFAIALVELALCTTSVSAHKSPLVEYGTAGTWRTGYSYIPRQPVIGEPITLTEQVSHLNGTIGGNVTMTFSVYEDDSVNKWYAGKQYKSSDWLLISHLPGQPMPGEVNKFETTFIVDRPGNYFVTVDLYQDGQFIGQDMRAVDVEQSTIGPLFLVFSVVIVAVVLIGVKRRVL